MTTPTPTALLQRFRTLGLLEGLSLLILVGLAMPLKHLAGMPLAVRVVGPIHGLLFLAYCAVLLSCWRRRRWPPSKVALLLLAALVPGGTLFTDRGLRAEQEREGPPPAPSGSC